jgi:hypothetical protein
VAIICAVMALIALVGQRVRRRHEAANVQLLRHRLQNWIDRDEVEVTTHESA